MIRSQGLFSVRMRASAGGSHEEGGRHLCGAERLAAPQELEAITLQLLRRGRAANPDFLRIVLDRLPELAYQTTPCLPITTVETASAESAAARAGEILRDMGIGDGAITAGLRCLALGPRGDGQVLAGAVLLEAQSGFPISTPSPSGVRASRFDYHRDVISEVHDALNAAGLGHFRTFEALSLATKVLWSGVLAELCWSDDPDYLAGYVATRRHGYVRFPKFKPPGAAGGRVFYVPAQADLKDMLEKLTRTPLLIASVPLVYWEKSE